MRQKNPEPVFVPQFESAEAVERRIANRENEDMNAPEWNWCGICCVRMILLGLGRDAPTREEMYRTAFDQGVFKMVDGNVIGAYHSELADYIAQEFGYHASTHRRRTTEDLARSIADGAYAIVSVSAAVRDLDGGKPERKNGHLVLAYAVEQTEQGRVFVLHNSAGFASTHTQVGVRVTETRLNECFSGCYVSIGYVT